MKERRDFIRARTLLPGNIALAVGCGYDGGPASDTGGTIGIIDESRFFIYTATLGSLQLFPQSSESPVGRQNYRAIFNLLV